MQRIRFFKQEKVETLRENIKTNLAWYRGEPNAVLKPTGICEEFMEMTVSFNPVCFDSLNQNTGEKDDTENVVAIYNALKLLLPQQAADERIWVYATHALARKYASKRWAKIPGDDKKAVKYIDTHYFVSGARSLIRDNAVSRLWWMGFIASRCGDYNLKKTLEILLREPDVRANLLERPSASMSSEIFSAVIRLLGKSLKQSKSKEPEIYKRENFRSLMKTLNQRGGRIMLNSLSNKQLDAMLDKIAEDVCK